MKTSITISKVESKYGSFGSSYLLVAGDGVEFRVVDTDKARRTYVVGRIVDVAITPRKS